jgi:hypothetical protein
MMKKKTQFFSPLSPSPNAFLTDKPAKKSGKVPPFISIAHVFPQLLRLKERYDTQSRLGLDQVHVFTVTAPGKQECGAS